MLNSQWLETFTCLCETGGYSRAAERLNMTQPGVSQHMRKLEQQVGQQLVTKSGKSFTLTEAGEAVYRLGVARRAEEEQLAAEIGTDDPSVGTAALACSGSFAMILYPDLVAEMAKASQLSVHLEAAPQSSILAGLVEGKFDLGVLDHPPHHARIEAERIGFEELCLILPASVSENVPTFSSLETLGFIAHPDGYEYADALFSLNYPGEFEGARRLRQRGFVNQIGQIPAPVASGVGYTILPRSGVATFRGRGKLRISQLPKPVRRDIWLAWRRGRTLPGRVNLLAAIVRDVAARLRTVSGAEPEE
ncbi:LysR family transcriptional regulator [Roseibium sp.]|uniref:LysR family transcriptional regulator n=1 Tax=Roseibium sp. TaxID=1936156 RepID=UPI003A98149E